MNKIKELLKKLRGDPERCAKCAEDVDFTCPYAGDPDGCNSPTRGRFPVRTDEIADELEKEIERFHFRYRAKLEKQKAEKKAKDKHKGLLAKTRLVRLRLTDIDYILNRIDECVEPDGEPGFRSRVRACLLGSKEAALEGLKEDI